MVDKETAVDQEIGALVRRHAVRHAAPPGLADRISDSLQAASRPQVRVPANSNWRSMAMAASLLPTSVLKSRPMATEFMAVIDQRLTSSGVDCRRCRSRAARRQFRGHCRGRVRVRRSGCRAVGRDLPAAGK